MADHPDPVAEWLLGDPSGNGFAGPNGNGFAQGAPGLLERLAEAYLGDPGGTRATLTLAGVALGIPRRDQANACTVTVEGAAVRLAFDGQPATAASGLLLPVGTVLNICGQPSMLAASFFTVTAGGVVQIAYWD